MNTIFVARRPPLLVLLMASMFAALCFSTKFSDSESSVHAQSAPSEEIQAANPSLQRLHQLTLELLAVNRKFQRANQMDRRALLVRLREIAAARHELLATLIRENPRQLLEIALPDHILATLPATLQHFFEQEVTIDGELEVMYRESETESELLHFLKVADQRYELHFSANAAPGLLTGTGVRVRGRRVGDAIAFEGFSDVNETGALDMKTTSLTVTQPVAPNTLGEQKVLVIMVNFQDNPSDMRYTVDYVRNEMFGTTNNFYREVSYQQTWLSGDVGGWFTIPMNSSSCDTAMIASRAKEAASAAGFNLAAYNRFVYVLPGTNACSWSGWGTIGGNPSQSWIAGSFKVRIVAHELGHNFGLYHSNHLECGPSSIGSNCSVVEYGDSLDIMGQSLGSAHFNAFQKERLGWLIYGNSPPVTTIQNDGTYWLSPYETVGNAPKALKILKSTDSRTGKRTWYYLEFRQPIGFDGFVSSYPNVINGVVFHTGSESSGNTSYLLDMTPTADPSLADWLDPALMAPRSFSDPNAGVTITTQSVSSNGATVAVSFGSTPSPCLAATPTLSVSPSATQWVSAGSTITYQVSLINNDSIACTSSNFDLRAVVPPSWNAAFESSTLTLSSGAGATTALRVISSSLAPDGLYNIGITAANSSAPSSSASSSVTCSIMSGLGVSVTSDQASYARNQSATINAVISAAGSPVPGATVTFVLTKPSGAKVTGNATTGSNGTAVFKYRFNKQKDPAGVYQLSATANLNGVSGFGVTSFLLR